MNFVNATNVTQLYLMAPTAITFSPLR